MTAKHKRFCEKYVAHLNGAKAARDTGYSERRCNVTAHDLLGRDDVKAYIAVLMKRREEESRVKAHLVLEELAVVGFSNVNDYVVADDGTVTLREGAHPDAMRAVSSIKHTITSSLTATTRNVEIKLWDKNSAKRMMGEHLSLFKNRLEVTGANGGPIEVDTESARQRIADRLARLTPGAPAAPAASGQ